MTMAALADRMKEYEAEERFSNDNWLILRIDGRSFSTRLRKYDRFDPWIRSAMVVGTEFLIKDIGRSMILSYTNSDEASFLLCADVGKMTEHWFGGRPQKMASVAASVFTVGFNEVYGGGATFDARIYTVPSHDAPNYFVWRMRDCRRNAINIMCHQVYGTEALDFETKRELEGHIPTAFLNGTTMARNCKEMVISNPTYADFAQLILEQRDGTK